MKIFIQIASYRDPELIPTINDCLSKARYPHNLIFGICLQEQDPDMVLETAVSAELRISRFHWSESKGACWARSQAQQLYDGEEFFLQLDSHHRFAQDWDATLLTLFEQSGVDKPLITTYPGAFEPGQMEHCDRRPLRIQGRFFKPNGNILTVPYQIEVPADEPVSLMPARFIAAGFLFTLGQHCSDCPYDPNLYFHGEELSLTVRSYSQGYDLFHPTQPILWHQYMREDQPKHWSDHQASATKSVATLGPIADQRLNSLLGQIEEPAQLGEFGLGALRTLHDYERFAGLSFSDRVLHRRLLRGDHPEIVSEAEWQTDNLSAIELTASSNRWRASVPLRRVVDADQMVELNILDHREQTIHQCSIAPPHIGSGGYGDVSHEFEFECRGFPQSWRTEQAGKTYAGELSSCLLL